MTHAELVSSRQAGAKPEELMVRFFVGQSVPETVQLFQGWQDVVMAINGAVYQRENQVYRKGNGVRPETKILFMVGNQQSRDVRMCRNFDGSLVRTKPASLPKVPESMEVITAISGYFNGEKNDLDELFSEIADIFYNLFHLLRTDPNFAPDYLVWIRGLAASIGLTEVQAGQLVLVKYLYRFYDKDGAYDYQTENERVAAFLKMVYQEMPNTEQLSCLFELLNTLFDRVLASRLVQLEGQFYRDQQLNGMVRGHRAVSTGKSLE